MSQLITLAKTNRKEFKRFTKFLVVGTTGFIVDFGLFNLLLRALNFNPVLAQAISFTAAAINNFSGTVTGRIPIRAASRSCASLACSSC
jgi:hypothetical protein